jgi:beta-lactamase regulating signal transducer with metallopeptidase domain
MQVLTHYPLLKALGWALFNSLWQMAALWLLYSLLIAIFHHSAARIRHGLALLLLAAGTIWTAVSFFTAGFLPGAGTAFWQPFFSPAQSVTGRFWQSGRNFVEEILPYGSTLYLLVLAALLVRYFSHYRHSRRLIRQGLSAMPPQFRTFVAATALQLGIRKPVTAWLSSLADVPLTLGFLKPVILLPAAMITHLTPQQVEAILVHELAHIQRKDYLLHLLITMLEGLFFFNPFARLLIRQLKKERENCCDDLVLQFKYDAHAYVSALLTLAARHQPIHRLAVAATGTGDRLLLQRAKRILLRQKGERLRPATRPLLLLFLTGLITALTLSHPLLTARKPNAVVASRTNTIFYIHPRVRTVSPRLTAFAAALSAGQPAVPTTHSTTKPAAALTGASIESSASMVTTLVTTHSTAPLATTSVTISRRLTAPPRTAPEQHDLAAKVYSADNMPRTYNLVPDGDNVAFVNTSDDAVGFGESAVSTGTAAIADDPGGNSTPNADNRDFSLILPLAITGPSGTVQQGSPFIPNSSLYFQYNQSDSTHPEEQLRYLQQSAQLEVLGAIAKLQQQMVSQWQALNNLRVKAAGSVRMRKEIDTRQLQLQKDYIMKIETWQRKLQKTTKIRVIVYI